MTVILQKSELVQMLELAAEKGAARALRAVKGGKAAKQDEWVTKEVALEYINLSYRQLNRLVNEGTVRKNDYSKHGQKFYCMADLVAYKTGKSNN